MSPDRQPPGQPSGAEFIPRCRPESEISLGGVDYETQLEARLNETLHELARCFTDAERIVALGKEHFADDWLTQRAAKNVVTEFAETVNRLPARFKSDHPTVRWRAINGMRNRIVHAYQHTDPEVVWNTMAIDFPRVRTELALPLLSE